MLKAHCPAVSLKRFDDNGELLDAAFLVEFDDFLQLEATKSGLYGLDESIRITFLDNKGLGRI